MPFKMHNVVLNHQNEVYEEFEKIGVTKAGGAVMAPKAIHRLIKIYDLTPIQATIIKQEMLSKGADAATAKGVLDASVEKTDLLLMGTEKQYRAVIKKLRMQQFGLPSLAEQLEETLAKLGKRKPRELNCRGKRLPLGERTLVMGILNVTPDSFSDGSRYHDIDKAIAHARYLEAEGADIIDLGGESTRPGYTPVNVEEEIDRVIPVLEALLSEVELPISIDTTKEPVARRALERGAHIINDQWALRADKDMASLLAEYKVPLIMMHNQQGADYCDLMGDMVQYFRESIDVALQAGIAPENIIIDPGIGFGKTVELNLETLSRLRELDCLGLPILLGTSRKSVIGKTLDLPPNQRVEGTGATVALGVANGVDIVRVHDVKEMVRVARMTDAIVRR